MAINEIKQIVSQNMARVYPLTPDGSQWEIKVFVRTERPTEEIIGEMTFRAYNGGLALLAAIVNPSIIAIAQSAIKQVTSGSTLIVPAKQLPDQRQ